MVYRTPTRSVPALWLSSVGMRSDRLIHLVEQGLMSAHAVAVKLDKLDRSPTGTGASARLALMHARGQVTLGTEVSYQSILGSEFRASIVRETRLGQTWAIVPRVSGRAWITGTSQLMLDPHDPWPTGYRLGDTWPKMPSN